MVSAIAQFLPSGFAHIPIIGNHLDEFLFFHAGMDYEKDIKGSLNTSYKFLSDNESQFVFIHLMVPHSPSYYNSKTDSFVKTDQGYSSYHENLIFLDKIIGQMRNSMETSGIWEDATVIFTSDHHLRTLGNDDLRVPFIIKLAG